MVSCNDEKTNSDRVSLKSVILESSQSDLSALNER
jgi:hypothetical protein